jgi:DNA-binding response OmpR family regulator
MVNDARILVTDDDPVLLELMTSVLSTGGYEVIEASTGQACLDAVREHHPDLVLLDVILPDMTGIQVCSLIKADGEMKDIIVILMSGVQVSSEFQANGLNVGADGYIARPVSNKELLARVRSMMRLKRAEDGLREKEKQQEKLIQDLEKAFAEIKTLKGFIPICASCKKIRDDEGFWKQLEAYITEHTNAVFSHGLCPECARTLYPQYVKTKTEQ